MFQGFKPRQELSGYTAIPNEWFDEVMQSIDNLAELKIVQAVFRKTYGWVEEWYNNKPLYKLEDEISYSQFSKMTGLSTASITEGIKRAISHGFIVQVEAGNFKKGTTGKYRIRSTDDKAQTLEETSFKEKPKEKPKPKPKKVEEKEVYSTKDVSPKRRTQYDAFKEKEVENYNANDICYYFSDRYSDKIKVQYSRITNKDRGLAKKLLTDYGAETVVKVIDYLLDNYTQYINGYPSIAVLYGFRNSLVPSALKGKPKAKDNVRETSLSDEDIEKAEQEKDIVRW